MIADADIIRSLTDYIVNEIAGTPPATPPTPDTRIIEAGLVDSLGLFKLVAFIEDQCEVKIDPQDILIENFATIGMVASLIRAKRGK